MNIVAALLPNPVRMGRLRSAVAGRLELVPCDNWSSLTRLCESTPIQSVVVDFCSDGHASFDELRVLRGRFPRIAIVGYVSSPPAKAHDIFDAGRFGLSGLIVADENDSAASILAVLEVAETRNVAVVLRRALKATPPLVRDATLLAVARASARLTPEKIAQVLNVSRRTLSQHLAGAGFPAPQRLITWGRLIVAGYLLDSSRSSADGVAASLHFPSGSAFRNTCQRYLQATPREIKARGGADYVARALLRECHTLSSSAKGSPAPRSRSRTPLMAV